MAPVEVCDLSKRFGRVEAVKNLSFDVQAGRVTGFLGPNGAGKSTTLRALLGLIHPTAGTARFDGKRYEDLEHPSATVGAVLEDASFHPGRSARNHLRVLATTGRHPAGRVDQVLADVGLTAAADRRVKGYSMGMRQRLAIAAALLGDPEVLILDEPTNGLDPPGIAWMRGMVREQAGSGRAVLISSHLLAEVAQSVDDVVIIAKGRLRAHLPARDDEHVVDGLRDLGEHVAGDEHRAPARGLLAHHAAHPGDARRVEAVGRLVEDQHLGVAEQRRRDRQPLAHAHRVALHTAVGGRLQSDRLEHLVDALRRMAPGRREHAQVIARRAAGVKRGVLEHGADGRARMLEILVALAVEARRPGRRVDQPEQRPQRRALAGAVGSEKPGDATGLDIEAEVLDRLDVAEALGEVADLDWWHRAA